MRCTISTILFTLRDNFVIAGAYGSGYGRLVHGAPSKMIRLGRGVPEIARSYLLKNKGFIGGGWVPSSSGRAYPVLNPANQELISEVADMSPQDVNLAVHEAKGAMKQWSSMVPKVLK